MRDLDGLDDIVVGVMSRVMAPVMERLAVAEAKLVQHAKADETIVELRERLVVAETKASLMRPDTSGEAYLIRLAEVESKLAAERDTEPLARRITALEARPAPVPAVSPDDVAALRERVAVVEVKQSIPGPPGPAGKDGRDGKDGLAGLSFEGVYQDSHSYDKGMLATWAGSTWHCNEPTTSKPGESKAWTLMVKRGRDGKDGKDAPGALPIVQVRS